MMQTQHLNHLPLSFQEEQEEEDLHNEEKQFKEQLQTFQDFVTKQISENRDNLEQLTEKIDNLQDMMQELLQPDQITML